MYSINKDYCYRSVYEELRKRGILINKNKIQSIMQKLNLQVKLTLQERVISIAHTKKSCKGCSQQNS
ncbi:MAG: transposase [Clostridium sartagoforme]|nr:transposase [Clostridium sartagoforme]